MTMTVTQMDRVDRANGDGQREQVSDDFDVHKGSPWGFEQFQLSQGTARLRACQGTVSNVFRNHKEALRETSDEVEA
jgi:hypothetical protein